MAEHTTAVARRRIKELNVGRGIIDLPFLILTLLLVFIGLVMLFSASYARAYSETGNVAYYFVRQAGFAAVGIVAMLAVTRVPYQWFRKWSLPLLAVSIVLLMAVLVAGSEDNGAKRWIFIGFISFQPSEITKLALVLTFAGLISGYGERMKTFQYGVLPFSVIMGIIFILLKMEPHLSCIVIIAVSGAGMMFMGGTKLRYFVVLGIIGALGFFWYISTQGYAGSRIDSWLHPELDPTDSGYQVLQSLYAIGSGGLGGLGLGRSRQKYLYLPEEHNDYIFSIVCEELGFVGASLIILLFLLLFVRGFWLALHAKDKFSALSIAGIVLQMTIQVFFNIGVVSNLLPSTGISLPFFSYGGTALLLHLFEMGIILNLSRDCTNNRA
ncbi:MAG: putative lipid II flippase FtsW [Oscillospiraceae bacterium]|nr:putative lipid II flippase FtsW [Oscillospiraceae bacterium]